MTEAVQNAVRWFDVFVHDLDRAAFYDGILGIALTCCGGLGLGGALFPVPDVSGTLIF